MKDFSIPLVDAFGDCAVKMQTMMFMKPKNGQRKGRRGSADIILPLPRSKEGRRPSLPILPNTLCLPGRQSPARDVCKQHLRAISSWDICKQFKRKPSPQIERKKMLQLQGDVQRLAQGLGLMQKFSSPTPTRKTGMGFSIGQNI